MLELKVLGECKLWLAGLDLDLPPKRLVLVVYLALEGRTLERQIQGGPARGSGRTAVDRFSPGGGAAQSASGTAPPQGHRAFGAARADPGGGDAQRAARVRCFPIRART